MKKSVVINGFGRIGRVLFRILFERDEFEVFGVNDIYDLDEVVYLLKYDSVYGPFGKEVEKIDDGRFRVGDKEIFYFRSLDLSFLKDISIDLLIECSGVYKHASYFEPFLEKSVKKVIFSFVPSDDTKVIILGVNEKEYEDEKIVSNSSCTSNCLAPVLKLVNEFSPISRVFATTIHSYTAEQNLLDSKIASFDIRRSRASGINIIPFTSGIAFATERVLPFLKNRIRGYSLRVPVCDVTMIDTVLEFENFVDFALLKEYLRFLPADSSKYVFSSSTPVVSSDIISSAYSSIVDLSFISGVGGNFVKLLLWQDNEWGYASRVADLSSFIFSLE